ncbi:carbohydrate ABC transporter permease [Planomonospora sp. ID67723]|uniref:carbohydrate ABC transporter permease n=1 Tax=Planomonospora sp. ID67723 TaxID=2738134 RepID=UPI0018C3695F|nr:carbohydrate ABC transporter permease [Planomonospora sp. ID67723]MBG0829728.1 carbohydrate ABC transporter permease [Planomonospora sp. ID67723]
MTAAVSGARGKRRAQSRSAGGRAWVVHAALAIALVAAASPFAWMLSGSVKTDAEIRRVPPTWLPDQATLDNYRELFERLDFTRYFVNSLIVTGAVTLGNLVFCSMLGYALAKIDFPGRRALFALVLGTLMVPGAVTFVPLFVLVSNLGLVDSYLGMILPFLAGPFGVFLMRQYISGLPDEVIDAARIDGAGQIRIFLRIVAPLARPALATLGILTFLGTWNSFLWPLVVAQSEEKYTLPVALALYSIGQNQTRFGLLLAGAVVVVVPVLVVFVALQRFFVQGIATTGLK